MTYYIIYFTEEEWSLGEYLIETTRTLTKEYLEELSLEAHKELENIVENETNDGDIFDYNEWLVDYMKQKLNDDKLTLKPITEVLIDLPSDTIIIGDE